MAWRKENDTGQDLVEYALVLPLFLLLILGVIEFGLLFFQYNMITNAAREGARAGIVMATDTCPASCIEDRIDDAARALTVGLTPLNLAVTPDLDEVSSAGVHLVSVTVRYKTNLLTKIMIEAVGGKGDVTLQSTATMQREY